MWCPSVHLHWMFLFESVFTDAWLSNYLHLNGLITKSPISMWYMERDRETRGAVSHIDIRQLSAIYSLMKGIRLWSLIVSHLQFSLSQRHLPFFLQSHLHITSWCVKYLTSHLQHLRFPGQLGANLLALRNKVLFVFLLVSAFTQTLLPPNALRGYASKVFVMNNDLFLFWFFNP